MPCVQEQSERPDPRYVPKIHAPRCELQANAATEWNWREPCKPSRAHGRSPTSCSAGTTGWHLAVDKNLHLALCDVAAYEACGAEVALAAHNRRPCRSSPATGVEQRHLVHVQATMDGAFGAQRTRGLRVQPKDAVLELGGVVDDIRRQRLWPRNEPWVREVVLEVALVSLLRRSENRAGSLCSVTEACLVERAVRCGPDDCDISVPGARLAKDPDDDWTVSRDRVSEAMLGIPTSRVRCHLEPISRAKAAMSLTCALVCCGSSVALQHLTRAPSCQTHEVSFVASARKELMRERVT